MFIKLHARAREAGQARKPDAAQGRGAAVVRREARLRSGGATPSGRQGAGAPHLGIFQGYMRPSFAGVQPRVVRWLP